MVVDFAEKALELGFADENERFGVVIDVPDVVAVVKVSMIPSEERR